ncbi:MAG: 50S ribosomal protein L1 [Hyphomicrobiales bacterium]|nr:50S ribosomal protein L1 [Hyphomicrobiales bacterium]
MAEKKTTKKSKASGLRAPRGGKRLEAANKTLEEGKVYPLNEAVKLVKGNAKAKFDETIEVVFNLGVDPRHSDQIVRGVIAMPNGIGKKVRVAVFARDAKAEAAQKAGADVVGAEELVEEIKAGTINFDVCIATPDLMGLVGGVARILGPKGLMPNPKLGTVTDKVEAAIKNAKAGQVEYRTEKTGLVHAGVAKASFTEKAIEENILALFNAVKQAKPSGVKGTYMEKLTISSTMGPGVQVDINSVAA